MRPQSTLRSFLLLALLLTLPSGCGKSNGTFVKLHFSGTVRLLAPIQSIVVDARLGAETVQTTFPAPSQAGIDLPTTSVLEIGSGEGSLVVHASALAGDGTLLGTGSGTGTVVRGKTVDIEVVFGSSLPDAAVDGPSGADGPSPGRDATWDTAGADSGTWDGGGIEVRIDGPGAGGAPGTGGAGGAGGTGGDGGPNLDAGPGYVLTVNPPSLDFGIVLPGVASPAQAVTVTNAGTSGSPPLTLFVSDPVAFPVSQDTCTGVALAPAARCVVLFTFHPTVPGAVQADGSVGPAAGASANFTLLGAGGGVKPELLLTPPVADFQIVDVNATAALDFTLRNIGTADAGTITVHLASASPSAPFRIGKDGCSGSVLAGQGQCLFTVVFAPTTYGATSATVAVESTLGLNASATATGGGRDRVPVTVRFLGLGSGTVTGAGVGCVSGSTACVFDVPRTDSTATLTLTAVPATGSSFVGWTDGGCSGTGTCTVGLSSPPTVTANFALLQYTLTVNKAGNGTVTSSRGEINCGTVCSATFSYGQSVTLSATAGSDSTFSGWSGGGCSGTGTCAVTVTAATTVTANFKLNPYTLTVRKTVGGNVTSSPAGINCGSTCMASFAAGTNVVLTATPSSGYAFSGWSGGDCTGTATCQLAMTTSKVVQANFVEVLTCTSVNTVNSCTNGSMQNLMFTGLSAAQCHDRCAAELAVAGQTSGCWILTTGGTCYCRNGTLNTGGTSSGGSCS